PGDKTSGSALAPQRSGKGDARGFFQICALGKYGSGLELISRKECAVGNDRCAFVVAVVLNQASFWTDETLGSVCVWPDLWRNYRKLDRSDLVKTCGRSSLLLHFATWRRRTGFSSFQSCGHGYMHRSRL